MVIDAVLTEAANYRDNGKAVPLNLGFTRESKVFPDKLWLLQVLSTLNPNHPFFAKDYMPPPKREKKNAPLKMDNSDGFFTGIGKAVTDKYLAGKKTTKRTNNTLVRVGI